MYTTTPYSLCRKYPSVLSKYSAYSGNLVFTDEESQEMDSFCFGIYKHDRITKLPFPQDRILKVVHASEYDRDSVKRVWFVPVLDQPLSSNRYYVIKAKGKHKGRAYVCSRDRATRRCCFDNNVSEDLKPKQFNHKNIYQQFEICPFFNGSFFARAVAWGGIPPKFLRRKGWELHISHSFPRINLREAQGLSSFQPVDLPALNAPISSKRSTPIVIGKWYCPCVFVREGIKEQETMMKKSLFYEVSLKLWWEEISACDNDRNRGGNVVSVDARVRRLLVLINGVEAKREEKQAKKREGGEEEFVWFVNAEERRAGLSSVVIERLRSVQERRGWFDGGGSDVRVEGTEEIGCENGWRRFGCYVLVESFVFRRVDNGSLLINFNWRNTNNIICTWV